jgi:hypothetical protein
VPNNLPNTRRLNSILNATVKLRQSYETHACKGFHAKYSTLRQREIKGNYDS